MNFNSLSFLLYFVVVFFVHRILPFRFRWIWLLASSYFFYLCWNVWLIVLILFTTATAYVAGIRIEGTKDQKVKRKALVWTLVICLGILFFFKYFSFTLQITFDLLRIFGLSLDPVSLNIPLPVGISFYTFQTLSYVIDVYRGTYSAERHFGYFALFICFFPQLVAGPIERPKDLLPQFRREDRATSREIAEGFCMTLCGFIRKVVIADNLGVYVDRVFSQLETANVVLVLLAGGLFLIQIYCDFAGYSEIAMGTARMLGVRLSRNFNRPYQAKSYGEFFRRWHITLNTWFHDYLYIPLGGNRKGKARRVFNTFVVFTLCGLWHGADWTFVLWGMMAAFFCSLEYLFRGRSVLPDLFVLRVFKKIVLIFLFILSALLFRSENMTQFCLLLQKLFTLPSDFTACFKEVAALFEFDISRILFLVLIFFLLVRLNGFLESKSLSDLSNDLVKKGVYVNRVLAIYYGLMLVAVCWVMLYFNQDSSVFLYFQF